MHSNLNTIQEWCELLADLIWSTRQQVGNVARINGKTIAELRQPHLTEMLDDMGKQVSEGLFLCLFIYSSFTFPHALRDFLSSIIDTVFSKVNRVLPLSLLLLTLALVSR